MQALDSFVSARKLYPQRIAAYKRNSGNYPAIQITMKIAWKIITIVFVMFTICPAQADDWESDPAFSISGYAEAYYSLDLDSPAGDKKTPLIYSYHKNNEVAINLAFVKGTYSAGRVRASLALAGGSYMNTNYASEPGILNNLYEGNIGLKLSDAHNLWLDAGVFPSHLGFESATGKDNWTLSRSLTAENSPYYETGAKINYTSQEGTWFLSALILNGWQRIQRAEGNSSPSFGTQITYKPSPRITLNSSLFIGNDKPDPVRKNRIFHDFYGIFKFNETISAIVGLDIGAEQKFSHASSMHSWYNSTVILKYQSSAKSAIAVRVEYFADQNGVIIKTGTPGSLPTWGFSANYDYHISDNLLWRLEARTLNSRDNIFTDPNRRMADHDTFVTTAFAASF